MGDGVVEWMIFEVLGIKGVLGKDFEKLEPWTFLLFKVLEWNQTKRGRLWEWCAK